MAELLGWLQRRLALQWLDAAPDAAVGAVGAAGLAGVMLAPPAVALIALDELVRLGYLRGIQRKLDAIEAEHPASAVFVDRLRTLARGFQLDTLAHLVQSALAATAAAPAPASDRPSVPTIVRSHVR
jgi:hypothetical protein